MLDTILPGQSTAIPLRGASSASTALEIRSDVQEPQPPVPPFGLPPPLCRHTSRATRRQKKRNRSRRRLARCAGLNQTSLSLHWVPRPGSRGAPSDSSLLWGDFENSALFSESFGLACLPAAATTTPPSMPAPRTRRPGTILPVASRFGALNRFWSGRTRARRWRLSFFAGPRSIRPTLVRGPALLPVAVPDGLAVPLACRRHSDAELRAEPGWRRWRQPFPARRSLPSPRAP